MELLADQWKRTLSANEAMGEEYLKCKRGWANWWDSDCEEVIDFALKYKEAISVRYGTDLVSALP